MMTDSPRPALVFSSAVRALEAREFHLARQLFWAVIQHGAFRIAGLHGMGLAFERERKFQKAEDWYRAVLVHERSARGLLRLARVLEALSRSEEALTYADQISELQAELGGRDRSEWLELRVNILKSITVSSPDPARRLSCGLEVLRAEPTDLRILLETIRAAKKLGSQDRIIPLLEKLIQAAPSDLNLRVTLASLQIQMGQFEVAEKQLYAVLERDGANVHARKLFELIPQN